jgi:hypothetical protein
MCLAKTLRQVFPQQMKRTRGRRVIGVRENCDYWERSGAHGAFTTNVNGWSSAYRAVSNQHPESGRSIAVMIIGPVSLLNAPDARSEDT